MTGLAQLGAFLRALYYGSLVLLAVNLFFSLWLRLRWSMWYAAIALASVIAGGVWAVSADKMPGAAQVLFYPALLAPIHFILLLILATVSFVRKRRAHRRVIPAGMEALAPERSFDAP